MVEEGGEASTCSEGPDSDDENGVLLYYCYTTLPYDSETADRNQRMYSSSASSTTTSPPPPPPFVLSPSVLQSLHSFYKSYAPRLVGRVRVASDGINVTLGGRREVLLAHIKEVLETLSCPSLLGPRASSIDFKLSGYSPGRRREEEANEIIRRETGFDRLQVKVVKEVVSLGEGRKERGRGAESSCVEPAQHLSPREFHRLLQTAEDQKKRSSSSSSSSSDIILLDARNLYEQRIGRFEVKGVAHASVQTRSFAELPQYFDAETEKELRGKRVMMYCTGGVRCEQASVYLRSICDQVEPYQLKGGIHRYLEAFPDGGFFRGKNFVFDDRIAMHSEDETVVGRCLGCRSPFDDYSSRRRCRYCRMLILVCEECHLNPEKNDYLCELCLKHGRGVDNNAEEEPAKTII